MSNWTATTIATLLALSACSSTASNLVVTERSAQAQCAGISSGVTVVTPQTIQRLQQRQFLTEPSDDKAVNEPATAELLIAVSHGAQPSPGYQHELRSAALTKGVVELNLHWKTPPPGSMQATVMTNPCLVLALPKGDYQRVVAQDQNGVVGVLDLEP